MKGRTACVQIFVKNRFATTICIEYFLPTSWCVKFNDTFDITFPGLDF